MPDYIVKVADSPPIPVRAANQAAARNFAVRQRVTVEPLTTDDAMAFGAAGVAMQDATAEPSSEPEAGE